MDLISTNPYTINAFFDFLIQSLPEMTEIIFVTSRIGLEKYGPSLKIISEVYW